jgi:hypothetical protein
VDHANEVRFRKELNEEKKEYILISDDWYSKLMEHPYVSSMIKKNFNLQ